MNDICAVIIYRYPDDLEDFEPRDVLSIAEWLATPGYPPDGIKAQQRAWAIAVKDAVLERDRLMAEVNKDLEEARDIAGWTVEKPKYCFDDLS